MDSSIHVGLDRGECLDSRKDMLISEQSLLQIISHMKGYTSLRKQEYALKNKIKAGLAEIHKEIGKIELTMPKGGIAHVRESLPEKKQKLKFKEAKIKEKKIKTKSNIETQLEEIQAKLSRLQ